MAARAGDRGVSALARPDFQWQLIWRLSQDETELIALLVNPDPVSGKGYKIGSIASSVASQNPQIHKRFVKLMKTAAAVAMRDLTGVPGDSLIAVIETPKEKLI